MGLAHLSIETGCCVHAKRDTVGIFGEYLMS